MNRTERILETIDREGGALIPVVRWRLIGHFFGAGLLVLVALLVIAWPVYAFIDGDPFNDGGLSGGAITGMVALLVLGLGMLFGGVLAANNGLRRVLSVRGIVLSPYGIQVMPRDLSTGSGWQRIPWDDVVTAKTDATLYRMPFWPRQAIVEVAARAIGEWALHRVARENAERAQGSRSLRSRTNLPPTDDYELWPTGFRLPWGLEGGPFATARVIRAAKERYGPMMQKPDFEQR